MGGVGLDAGVQNQSKSGAQKKNCPPEPLLETNLQIFRQKVLTMIDLLLLSITRHRFTVIETQP